MIKKKEPRWYFTNRNKTNTRKIRKKRKLHSDKASTKMDDYDAVQKGGLRLKGVSSHGGKKKKKKDKEKKKMEEMLASTNKDAPEEVTVTRPSKTKAELAYEKSRRKKNEELILERASKSHKERIMDFNQQLDNLTEHFDIPKVSWTK